MKIAMNVVGAFTTGGRGWNRTIGVSCVTGYSPLPSPLGAHAHIKVLDFSPLYEESPKDERSYRGASRKKKHVYSTCNCPVLVYRVSITGKHVLVAVRVGFEPTDVTTSSFQD